MAGNLCTVPHKRSSVNFSTTGEKEQNQCQDKHQQHGSEDHFSLPSGAMQFIPDQHTPGGTDQRLTPRDGHGNGIPQHSTRLDGEQTAQAVGETSREAQEVLPGRQFRIAPHKAQPRMARNSWKLVGKKRPQTMLFALWWIYIYIC